MTPPTTAVTSGEGVGPPETATHATGHVRALQLGAVGGLLAGSALTLVTGMGGSVGLLVPMLAVGSTMRVAIHLALSATVGALAAWTARRALTRTPAAAATAAAVGVLVWLAGPLTGAPLLVDRAVPAWSAAAVARTFPSLVAFVLVAVGGGLVASVLARVVPAPAPTAGRSLTPSTRVVVVGGGFGGTAVARRLVDHFRSDPSVEVTLVSDDTVLLFTPMLAEVAGGALEPHHISAPLRAAAPGVDVRRGRVTAIDQAARTVTVKPPDGVVHELGYDHLVLAVGAVPDLRGLPGLDGRALTMKRLSDAVAIRGHVLGMLERAEHESDPTTRRRLLTFVVAGGGFAGAEAAAELFDLIHSVQRFYPGLVDDAPRVVLVHSRDRILPEIGDRLAGFALGRLRRRGIEFVLGARVAGASDDEVRLTVRDGEGDREHTIAACTLVWTAGTRPAPLIGIAGFASGRGGTVAADDMLRVQGHERLWAVGDCATVPVPAARRATDGDAYPPTAQHALRQGRACADNIAAAIRGGALRPFDFRTQGTLVALGHRTAVADVRGLRLSGFAAWVLWRAVYLAKLPGLEKKVRVCLDWVLELFFPRDIAVTDGEATRR